MPGVGEVEATLINAGNPAVFVSASSMGLSGTELQGDINGDADLLTRFEAIRAHGAVMMGRLYRSWHDEAYPWKECVPEYRYLLHVLLFRQMLCSSQRFQKMRF